ncbi:hypothetical protein Cs308_0057 [Candidatus Chlamydia sanziniae]|uniref:Uncharacterized protein n=2 Tax=Candidatus Chlamydia sanziniae TaxID=1806891 RepID=A0A1A9HVV2_9CHLA|nr:hypothetical protein Cs308_0057 [Candidatus Chlamydia sanziniae]
MPERILAHKAQHYAAHWPKVALAAEIISTVALGPLKILTIPLASAFALTSLPIRAIWIGIKTKSFLKTLPYLIAWLLSLLVLALFITTIFSMIFIPPEVVFLTLGILIAVGTSATLFQVHKNLFPLPKEPEEKVHPWPVVASDHVPLTSEEELVG